MCARHVEVDDRFDVGPDLRRCSTNEGIRVATASHAGVQDAVLIVQEADALDGDVHDLAQMPAPLLPALHTPMKFMPRLVR